METTLLAFLIMIGGYSVMGMDLMRTDGEKGPIVVQAVVDVIRENCVIQADRMFLERLAVIQSNNGYHPRTYRSEYHGGIWQIDEDKYNSVRNCSEPRLADLCVTIGTHLNISWEDSKWRDLRKPLYSGIAASLYIRLNHPTAIPGNPSLQAKIWKKLFDPAGDEDTYVTLATEKITDDYCERPIDLTFIIDASGSVRANNFEKMKTFMKNVIDGLKIGREAAQVATVTFETTATVNFKLNTYDDADSIKKHIDSIPYPAGWTRTDLGLQLAASDIFVAGSGLRENSAQVALVITDGVSNDNSDTVRAAKALRDKGVLIFSIGVGNINIAELNDIATDPDCYHVFVLEDFTEIDDIINEIQKSACRAQLSFATNDNDNEVVKSKVIPFVGNKTEVNLVIPAPKPSENSTNTTTIVTDVTCGVVYIYASYDSTHPSEAVYSYNDVATVGTASVMSIKDDGTRPLYVTYQGKKYRKTNATRNVECDIKSSVYQAEAPKTEVVCLQDDEERACDMSDFRLSGYHNYIDEDSKLLLNLCDEKPTIDDPNTVFMPHPLDSTKFVKCTENGHMFIMQCPDGEDYHGDVFTCGHSNRIPLDLFLPLVDEEEVETPAVDPKFKSFLQKFLKATRQIEQKQKLKAPRIICRTKDSDNDCNYFHLRTSNHSHILTKDSWLGAPNPCDPDKELNEVQSITHKNDLDPKKFITCTEGGVMYVGECPKHLVFEETSTSCKKTGSTASK